MTQKSRVNDIMVVPAAPKYLDGVEVAIEKLIACGYNGVKAMNATEVALLNNEVWAHSCSTRS